MMLLLPPVSDVDTACAVDGQLAGACFGLENIPDCWQRALQSQELLEKLFGEVLDLMETVSQADDNSGSRGPELDAEGAN